MDKPEITAADRYRCVLLARYKVINMQTGTLAFKGREIEVDPDGPEFNDIRHRYANPAIRLIPERQRLEVRVYDEDAVDLGRTDVLGDASCALKKCEEALKSQGYTVVFSAR